MDHQNIGIWARGIDKNKDSEREGSTKVRILSEMDQQKVRILSERDHQKLGFWARGINKMEDSEREGSNKLGFWARGINKSEDSEREGINKS